MAKPVWATNDVPSATQFNEFLTNINFARKTTNQSVTSSTTNVADLQLFVPVQANAIYVVKCVLNYTGSTAGDMKALFRVPTGGTFSGMGTILIVGAASQQDIQTLPYGLVSETWGCLGGTSYGMVDGLLITSGTAGDFAIDWAQNTSSATATTIQVGSYLNLQRVS